ncbi:MAG: hypothetical protein Q8R28_01800 [Dehalococcoidia bacterium]|nr:hypothetical protein [Dehalococcoidia bacterium]MDP2659451.1 hypothetical protein [Dehalococcoidia bacterium]
MTTSDCSICKEAEESFKARFKKELDSGEAEIINLEESESAAKFWAENDLPLAPVVVVVSEDEKLIAVLDIDEMTQAKPDSAESVSTPGVDGVVPK